MTDAQANGVGAPFGLGGDLPVQRLGFGAMRITGPGIGRAPDQDEAIAVLRRAVDQGVNLIDTADSYGPFVSERLIAEALHPYPSELVIATRADSSATARPMASRRSAPAPPRRMRGEPATAEARADTLYQLHRVDPKVPLEESMGMLVTLKDEGKIRHIGLSNVNEDQLDQALDIVPVVFGAESVRTRAREGPKPCRSVRSREPRVPPVGTDGPRRPPRTRPSTASLAPTARQPGRSRSRGCSHAHR